MITIIYAHPYPKRSRANRALLAAVRDVNNVKLRSLYDLYPDFGIDVESEQASLADADVIVWQHPIYWYSTPGLLKHWFDKVLARGWAYGQGGNALRGKTLLWVATTGGDEDSYNTDGMHAFPFDTFVPVIRQTADFCGMKWATPIVVHNAHRISDQELTSFGTAYRKQLVSLAAESKGLEVVHG